MSTQETKREQKRHLFSLLKIQKRNKGTTVIDLDDEIIAASAEMEQEDIAHVEKMVAQLP